MKKNAKTVKKASFEMKGGNDMLTHCDFVLFSLIAPFFLHIEAEEDYVAVFDDVLLPF